MEGKTGSAPFGLGRPRISFSASRATELNEIVRGAPFASIGDLEERIRNPEPTEPLTVLEILGIEVIALRLDCGGDD